jgi:hypothetical protein
VTVIVGDCREVMAGMAEASVDAVVCGECGAEFESSRPMAYCNSCWDAAMEEITQSSDDAEVNS